MRFEKLIQVPVYHVLDYHAEWLVGRADAENADDVRVVQTGHNFRFTNEVLSEIIIIIIILMIKVNIIKYDKLLIIMSPYFKILVVGYIV